MDCNPQESLENTTNTMSTLLGVHPIVPWTEGTLDRGWGSVFEGVCIHISFLKAFRGLHSHLLTRIHGTKGIFNYME